MFFDPIYFIFIAPGLLIGLIATALLKIWGNEYKSKQNLNHISGADLVNRVAQEKSLKISLAVSDGDTFSDNYNPSDKSLTLSRDIAYGTTITAVAITAHELGHALQHKEGSFLIAIRSLLVPAVGIGTNLGYLLIVIGFVVNAIGVSEIGLILFSLSTLFTLITLPIEIDASSRAINMLSSSGILFPEEIGGAKRVLTAAALTYVAALFESIGQILYFFFKIRKND